MLSKDFDYRLPPELIAQAPPERRSASRMLHLPAVGECVHRRFVDLPELLEPGDLLVLNETRVIPSRLQVMRESGGAVEVFLTRPAGDSWAALLRPSRRLKPGERLRGADGSFTVEVERLGDDPRVRLQGAPGREILEKHGALPLPPYIRRPPNDDDRERYQTVFARVEGAVAAPTAGLHFDDAMLAELERRGVGIARLVLHVGPGTFQPLPDDVDLSGHTLAGERYTVPPEVATRVRETRVRGRRVVAVGSTVVRSLESWAAAGSPAEGVSGDTSLFIREPFEFRVVDAMITNFHLPRSSLVCLVAAFVGRERILRAYQEAVRERYRFYSYGDVSFLEATSRRTP